MIFVTVGNYTPFDRLIKAVDEWAARRGRSDVFAQIGRTSYRPQHIKWVDFLKPQDFGQKMEEASVIVAHAGIGTIIKALELGKPVLAMPRRSHLHESPSDHQVATAKYFQQLGKISAALDETELDMRLDKIDNFCAPVRISSCAPGELLEALRTFINGSGKFIDGIICFSGVDWWYRSHGYYAMQMMRELNKVFPVLYVNPALMRPPKVQGPRIFLRRFKKRLGSFARGFKIINKNFAVLTGINIPKWLFARQVKSAASQMGIKFPLIWVGFPPAIGAVKYIPHSALVFQRTDRYETLPGANFVKLKAYVQQLESISDFTIFSSSTVFEEERAKCKEAVFIDHGVDYDHFSRAGLSGTEPADLKNIPHPRIGYIGNVEPYTFDANLFLEIAGKLPACSFVVVGQSALPEDWRRLNNVYFLGNRDYQEVADYMAACDVLIMPWNKNEWIKASSPAKLKEYLAVARPIVSRPFGELKRYEGLVSVADSAEDFIRAIQEALARPIDQARLRESVKTETWQAKRDVVLAELRKLGFFFIDRQ